MSNEVQFDFDEEQRPEYNHSGSKLSRLVVKLSGGLVKDEIQANYVLLGVAILAFIISLYLFFGATREVPLDKKSMEQMLQVHPELIGR